MKKLLFYGGTFDPPHAGHVHLLKSALRKMQFDKAIVMPTALPPHKKAAHFLSDEKRITALKMLFSSLKNLEVSDFELQKGGKSYSIDTLRYLTQLYSEYEIYMLMGSDMFFGFEKWFRFEEIAELCTLLVASRQPEDTEHLADHAEYLKQKYNVNSVILNIPVLKKSSTDVRSGKSESQLPLEVEYYIYGNQALKDVENYLKNNLSQNRYEHTKRVAEYAVSFAKQHGADINRAYLAGLLHDSTKAWSKAKHLRYLKQKHYTLTSEDRRSPQIFHQMTGALYAKEAFAVKDAEILNAIACHTTGKEKMSLLDKILFLSDGIELGRDYDGVQKIREMAMIDLDRAVIMYFDKTLHYILERGLFLHSTTVAARNYLLKNICLEDKHGGK